MIYTYMYRTVKASVVKKVRQVLKTRLVEKTGELSINTDRLTDKYLLNCSAIAHTNKNFYHTA